MGAFLLCSGRPFCSIGFIRRNLGAAFVRQRSLGMGARLDRQGSLGLTFSFSFRVDANPSDPCRSTRAPIPSDPCRTSVAPGLGRTTPIERKGPSKRFKDAPKRHSERPLSSGRAPRAIRATPVERESPESAQSNTCVTRVAQAHPPKSSPCSLPLYICEFLPYRAATKLRKS